MQADFRSHPRLARAEMLARAWLRPGTGQVSSLSGIVASPDGRRAVAAATLCEALEGAPSTRIAAVDLATGAIDILTGGPRSDFAPAWSPDGRQVAYLSDREQPQANRLRILDIDDRSDRATPHTAGFVEALQWSADGNAILLGVAGYGSDLAGAQGAFSVESEDTGDERASWMPVVEGIAQARPWRSAWIHDLATDSVRQVSPEGLNIWQAAWCGPDRMVAICSDQPEESCWYAADVRLIDIATGQVRTLYRPADQIWHLAVSPSGATVAVVEATCSDRMIVAGDLRLIDLASGTVERPTTLGADLVQLHWRDDERLLFAALRGPDSLIGLLDRRAGEARELWRGVGRTPSGAIYPEIAPLGRQPGDVLFQCESFFEAPTLLALEQGRERSIVSLGSAEMEAAVRAIGTAQDFRWTAPDGLTIHGWLLTPAVPGPHPLIMQVHGGPVWHTRPLHVARSPLARMALEDGYALFQPNPRGSSGRGQGFARQVFGDMGGKDTLDYLSGLDALEAAGLADPARIGVTGGSYGGYMSSWLVTQDRRFAAAVPVAPVTDWVSEYLTCHVPDFCELFLADDPHDPAGRYVTRSPVHFARRVRTPTLHICGALDRITPPGQALEFHHALKMAGVESVLVTYPGEGHGIRTMPAVFDYVARTMDWFARHMPARAEDRIAPIDHRSSHHAGNG